MNAACAIINQIYDVVIPALNTSKQVRQALVKFIPKDYPVEEIVTVFVFSTSNDTTNFNIDIAKVLDAFLDPPLA